MFIATSKVRPFARKKYRLDVKKSNNIKMPWLLYRVPLLPVPQSRIPVACLSNISQNALLRMCRGTASLTLTAPTLLARNWQK